VECSRSPALLADGADAGYDPAMGAFETSVDGVPVGAVPDCGAWIAQVNAARGTPTMGRSVITGTILDDEGKPVSFDAPN
jgi:hypothetical protein